MNKIKSRIKRILRIIWEYKYSIVSVMLILTVALSGIHFFKSGKYASANISFNYSEASNGLNPNKTRFNSYEIFSNEVLENAIALAGLQDSVTAGELAERINMNPVDTGSGGDEDYISTTYSISVDTDGLDIKNRTSMNVLENICNAYKTYFLTNNGDNQEILKIKLEITKDNEPYLRLNEIKLRVRQLEKYITARMNQNRAYVDEKTGASFNELDKRLKNIISYDIPNANAFIIECGVAKNAETLSEILEYKNKMDTISKDKQLAYYEADNNGIVMYEKLMSSIMMIPTMDEQEQYYMSRTKTAMDKMARNADSELEEATGIKKEIVSTDYVISKMRGTATSEENLAAAREMITKLENGLNDLSEELLALDKSYVEYKAQNYITFNYHKQSFIQKINLKKTLEELAVLAALGLVYLYVVALRKEKNEE